MSAPSAPGKLKMSHWKQPKTEFLRCFVATNLEHEPQASGIRRRKRQIFQSGTDIGGIESHARKPKDNRLRKGQGTRAASSREEKDSTVPIKNVVE